MRTIHFYSMNTNYFPDDILHSIKILEHRLEKRFNSNLEKCGLSAVQGRVLLFIARTENVTKKTISEYYFLSKSTTSELIKRMIKKDLIKIDKNGKNSYITITEKADALITLIKESRKNTVKTLEKNLNEGQIEELKQYLQLLIENLKGEQLNAEEN